MQSQLASAERPLSLKERESLQMSELPGNPGSVCVNLRKTLVWLVLMLNPGTITAESIWKLMIDGRPKGLFVDLINNKVLIAFHG